MTARVYIGFDGSSADDASVVMFDGQTYQFLGFVADDGLVVGDGVEAWYLDSDGNRVDIPATIEPNGWIDPKLWAAATRGGTITAFTVPLREADQQVPAIQDARPRCPKCNTPLSPCDTCGGPALCGDAWCAEHQPDVPD